MPSEHSDKPPAIEPDAQRLSTLQPNAPQPNAQQLHAPQPGDMVKRHRLSTRIWHAVNAGALLVLLMSGLMIFNAHPRLYWGQYGSYPDHAWLEIGAEQGKGFVKIGDAKVDTSGVLGTYTDGKGKAQESAFPYWATIPSDYNLGAARTWHFAFAWILSFVLLFYMLRSLFNGHIVRDLHIRRHEWSPAHIGRDIINHIRLRFPKGAEAARYHILQKLSYVGVIFILIPLMIGTGLTMSPGVNAAFPWMLDLFGGRQSARSLHFIAAFLLVGFFLVHMVMVLLSGPWNGTRAMITGRYRLPGKRDLAEANEAEDAP
jgi:thiosulfate reductase cytochrome b subunit